MIHIRLCEWLRLQDVSESVKAQAATHQVKTKKVENVDNRKRFHTSAWNVTTAHPVKSCVKVIAIPARCEERRVPAESDGRLHNWIWSGKYVLLFVAPQTAECETLICVMVSLDLLRGSHVNDVRASLLTLFQKTRLLGFFFVLLHLNLNQLLTAPNGRDPPFRSCSHQLYKAFCNRTKQPCNHGIGVSWWFFFFWSFMWFRWAVVNRNCR